MDKAKVLIIGLDGGTWDILKPAMDNGYMPYLKSMVGDGASGILKSTKPPITPAAWGSFQTGVNPGKNGVFDFTHWDKNTKRLTFVNSRSLQKTIWEITSEAGKRVGAINVPMTYPPRPINGYMITGMFTPTLESDFTYPSHLKEELLRAVPEYRIKIDEEKKRMSYWRSYACIDHLSKLIDIRAKAAQFVIDKEPLDLFMVHFIASDLIQHFTWGYMQDGHPLYDPKVREAVFEKIYSKLDRKIQEIQKLFSKAAKGECLTLIVSDHGFQAHDKRFNLKAWLCKNGYLKLDPASLRKPRLIQYIEKLENSHIIWKYIFSLNLPDRFKEWWEETQGRRPKHLWDKSSAFCVGFNGDGFIYILADDPIKYDSIAADLANKLYMVRDEESGTKVVSHIYRKDEIYSGAFLSRMPDLLLEPTAGYSFDGYDRSKNELHKVNTKNDRHIGKHHMDGIIIAAGRSVRRKDSFKSQIVDIAPTVLAYLGISPVKSMDGRVLSELFHPGVLKEISWIKEEKKDCRNDNKNESVYSQNDRSIIEKRLENLGYL